jgi:hypothetical protein
MNHKQLFIKFVQGMLDSGMVLLGKAKNPATGETYKNLEEAKQTIDMLMMLQYKTKESLDIEEKQVLDSSIQALQLHFIQEVNKSK